MFTPKQIQKYKRLKYTRELERFVNRIVSFLQQKERTREEISARIESLFEPFVGIEKAKLNNDYLKALERYVERVANLPRNDLDASELTKTILYEANLLQKTRRKKSFTKAKHKKRSIDEEY